MLLIFNADDIDWWRSGRNSRLSEGFVDFPAPEKSAVRCFLLNSEIDLTKCQLRSPHCTRAGFWLRTARTRSFTRCFASRTSVSCTKTLFMVLQNTLARTLRQLSIGRIFFALQNLFSAGLHQCARQFFCEATWLSKKRAALNCIKTIWFCKTI